MAILGYSLWQLPSIRCEPGGAGRSVVTLDGQHYTVVGIAPRHRFPVCGGDEGSDSYTPLPVQNTLPLLRDRRPHPIATIARLRPDATILPEPKATSPRSGSVWRHSFPQRKAVSLTVRTG